MIARLWPFIIGSAALGLDAYIIAGRLPDIAASLQATEASVGLGVAAFTGCYAIAGPLLAGRAGQQTRRSLVLALIVFTLANLLTLLSPTITVFLVARAVAGAAAGVFSPLSSAVAASLVPEHQRGRALSLVLAGLACGTVFGVPAGLLIAGAWGWRAAFGLIVCTGAAALLGVAAHRGHLPAVPASSPSARWSALTRPANLLTVTVTLLTAVASLGLYTYLAPVLAGSALASHGTAAIWVWGVGGAIGAVGIGRLVDRSRPLLISALLIAGLTAGLLGMTIQSSAAALLVSLFIWGLCGWASLAPQQHILLSTNPHDGATAVAANASANYLGSAIGATLGSVLIAASASPLILCWAAAATAALALTGQLARTRMAA